MGARARARAARSGGTCAETLARVFEATRELVTALLP
jgi:hypothetical protein